VEAGTAGGCVQVLAGRAGAVGTAGVTRASGRLRHQQDVQLGRLAAGMISTGV
jgi:hypothetical protein